MKGRVNPLVAHAARVLEHMASVALTPAPTAEPTPEDARAVFADRQAVYLDQEVTVTEGAVTVRPAYFTKFVFNDDDRRREDRVLRSLASQTARLGCSVRAARLLFDNDGRTTP